MRTIKLSAIYGRAEGIHIGEVPEGYEAPYSSVPVSLCGIGNNVLLGWYWKKTTATEVTCTECFEKAQQLYDDGAEVFDPSKPIPGWDIGRPEVLYEWCPIESTDGMIDLPEVTIREESNDAES